MVAKSPMNFNSFCEGIIGIWQESVERLLFIEKTQINKSLISVQCHVFYLFFLKRDDYHCRKVFTKWLKIRALVLYLITCSVNVTGHLLCASPCSRP